MAKRTIEIKQGTTSLVTLYSQPSTWAEADYAITNVEGIESWNNVEIETVPKLFGSGSYVVSKRITEKEVSVEASVRAESVRSIYTSLKSAAGSLNPVTVAMSGTAIETVEAFITGIDWNQIADDEANFTVSLKSVAGTLN